MTRAILTSGLIAALLVLFPAGRAFSSDRLSQDSSSVQNACEQLLNIKCFAFGGVGYAGTTSPGEIAFRAMLASTNALVLFETTLSHGTDEAKLYALCGIRRLDEKSFDASAKALKEADRKVRTMSGCLVAEEKASVVIQRIADGIYDDHGKR
jgi:hypothetical protein